jgi:hypothetical protein
MKRNVPPKTEKNGSYELRPHAPQGVKEEKKPKKTHLFEGPESETREHVFLCSSRQCNYLKQ